MVDLVIVCPHLGDGGVQRVVSMLANAWNRKGRHIVIITLYRESPCYAVDREIRVISLLDHLHAPFLLKALEVLRLGLAAILGRLAAWLGVRHKKRDPLRGIEALFERLPRDHRLTALWKLYLPALLRVRTLRAIVADLQPRVVLGLCGSTNVMTALACEPLPHRVIISERNDPARQRLEAPWHAFRETFYGRADLVTANTVGALEHMRAYVDSEKLHFIPNAVAPPASPLEHRDKRKCNETSLLTVGRLHPQKAQDVLLRAVSMLEKTMDPWRLGVVGQGTLEGELRELADRLGIADRVEWHGQVADPFGYYAASQIFVLPSLHEGTPNALLEAMSCGMAVIVTDASPGPLELVEHQKTGLVVPANDPAMLARAIERLASDPPLREALGGAARDRVAPYDLSKTLGAWESLFGWPPTRARALDTSTAA